MTGIFDWLASAPSSMGSPIGAAGMPPGTQPGPSYGGNRLGLIGAALQDAGASASGRPDGGAMLSHFQNLGLMANQARARQALAQAMQSGDPGAIQKARSVALASGLDPSQLAPRYMMAPNGAIVGIDPLTQRAGVVYQGGPRAPRGYRPTADGSSLEPIPGGPADPAVRAALAGARQGVVPANAPAAQAPFQYDEQGNELQ